MALRSGQAHHVRCVSPTWLALSLFFLAIVGSALADSDDDYLEAIEVEASKVGAASATAGSFPDPSGASPSSAMQAFEQQLQDRFAGTYLFYMRLSPGSKEEIFRQFKGGAPIEDVRRTIMARFLNTR